MAQDTLEFSTLASFEQYLNERPARGTAFSGAKLNRPHDISNTRFLELRSLKLMFGAHAELWLGMDTETNEVVLADMNTAGHGARSRIVRVTRQDIIDHPATMHEWYDNWAELIWR